MLLLQHHKKLFFRECMVHEHVKKFIQLINNDTFLNLWWAYNNEKDPSLIVLHATLSVAQKDPISHPLCLSLTHY